MDFTALAENLGLEEDEFLGVMELFMDTSLSDLEKLRDALKRGDAGQVVEAAHSIKGASGNMGFMSISDVAKDVELKAREKSLEGAEAAIKTIDEELGRIAVRLKEGF